MSIISELIKSSQLILSYQSVKLERFNFHLFSDLVLLRGKAFLLFFQLQMELTMKTNLKSLVINKDAGFIKIAEYPMCYSKN